MLILSLILIQFCAKIYIPLINITIENDSGKRLWNQSKSFEKNILNWTRPRKILKIAIFHFLS